MIVKVGSGPVSTVTVSSGFNRELSGNGFRDGSRSEVRRPHQVVDEFAYAGEKGVSGPEQHEHATDPDDGMQRAPARVVARRLVAAVAHGLERRRDQRVDDDQPDDPDP